jgi:hypothetical protein
LALSLDRHFAPIFNWSIHFKYAIATKGFEGFVGVVVSSAFLFFSALGVIPLLLLVFQKKYWWIDKHSCWCFWNRNSVWNNKWHFLNYCRYFSFMEKI